jgi:hypothetical protein
MTIKFNKEKVQGFKKCERGGITAICTIVEIEIQSFQYLKEV